MYQSGALANPDLDVLEDPAYVIDESCWIDPSIATTGSLSCSPIKVMYAKVFFPPHVDSTEIMFLDDCAYPSCGDTPLVVN